LEELILTMSTRIVRALAEIEIGKAVVTAVVGGSSPHLETVRAAAEQTDGPVEIRNDVENMAALMADSDVAISAGGSTCWELAFMGIPNVIVVLAENQRGIARGLSASGVSFNTGAYNERTQKEVADSVERLIQNDESRLEMAKQALQLVDGKGADRILEQGMGRSLSKGKVL